ncbi:MAG: TrkH family potassium uptake protein [Proteobacteria bacterium]|nr:TrkH family potassium uptake protein [Burkholderiales bacterium]
MARLRSPDYAADELQRNLGVVSALGVLTMIFGVTMMLPLAVSQWTNDGAVLHHGLALVATCACGALAWLLTRRYERELEVRDAFLLVVLVWTTLPAFATLPLLWAIEDLSFTDAYFETISGITTTGATVLTGLERLPVSLNVWRTQLVWMGGMGLIVLAVAVLPMLGVGGRQLFKAETPGPMKDSRLTPRLTETAKGLWLVYALLSAACMAAFWLAGMQGLDAMMHMFTTMGLGGFSSYDASFGAFDSVAIEVVAIVFMLAAGINFATHFSAFRGRSVVPYRGDQEARLFLVITLASGVGIALYLWWRQIYPDFGSALRFAMFNTVSIATTTGFASTDYAKWPMIIGLWMLFLSSFVTSAGSTGGGIKMVRAVVLYQQVYREFVRVLHPNAYTQVKFGGSGVANQVVFSVLTFLFVYVALIVTLTLVLVATDLDVLTAFTAVVACINNTGPGLGEVGPSGNYQGLTDFQTWVCTFAMLLGRLELFTLLIVLTPVFWRK